MRGGSPIEIDGVGFQAGMAASIGATNAPILSQNSNEMLVSAPAFADGTQSLTITDPSNGATVSLTIMLTFGAGPNDMIRLTQSVNSPTPVGGEAAYPIRAMITSADGSTPVGGATVQWNVNNGATLTACNGAPSCSVLTDDSGKVETRVDVGRSRNEHSHSHACADVPLTTRLLSNGSPVSGSTINFQVLLGSGHAHVVQRKN